MVKVKTNDLKEYNNQYYHLKRKDEMKKKYQLNKDEMKKKYQQNKDEIRQKYYDKKGTTSKLELKVEVKKDEKKCCCCKEIKHIDNFYKSSSSPDSLRYTCIECGSKQYRKLRDKQKIYQDYINNEFKVAYQLTDD